MEMDEVLQILASFEKHQLDYALIGAVALNFHGLVRATEDVDFFVRPTAENIDRLRTALHAVYDDPCIDEISTEDLLGDYPAVRCLPPDTDLYLDILTRLGEFASFDDLVVQEDEIEGIKVRLAAPETLYWLKKDTIRMQDRIDAENIKKRFAIEED